MADMNKDDTLTEGMALFTKITTSHELSLLDMPPEVRSIIYSQVLNNPQDITITATPLVRDGARVCDDSRDADAIPHLPLELVPLVLHRHDKKALSLADQMVVTSDCYAETQKKPWPSVAALLSTCKTIREELIAEMAVKNRRRDRGDGDQNLTLYVSRPFGVIVLKNLYPWLTRWAKHIVIAGHHGGDHEQVDPSRFLSPPKLRSCGCHWVPPTSISEDVEVNAFIQPFILDFLMRTPQPLSLRQKTLTFRTYYHAPNNLGPLSPVWFIIGAFRRGNENAHATGHAPTLRVLHRFLCNTEEGPAGDCHGKAEIVRETTFCVAPPEDPVKLKPLDDVEDVDAWISSACDY